MKWMRDTWMFVIFYWQWHTTRRSNCHPQDDGSYLIHESSPLSGASNSGGDECTRKRRAKLRLKLSPFQWNGMSHWLSAMCWRSWRPDHKMDHWFLFHGSNENKTEARVIRTEKRSDMKRQLKLNRISTYSGYRMLISAQPKLYKNRHDFHKQLSNIAVMNWT